MTTTASDLESTLNPTVALASPRRPREGRAGQVEVATFRQDSPYSDGRRPDSVSYCSAEEDALRRARAWIEQQQAVLCQP